MRFVQLALGDGEQPIDRERNPLVQPQLLFELLAAETKRRLGFRPNVGLEVLDVLPDRLDRFGRRIGEIGQQVQVVEIVERARQIAVDEGHHAAQRVDPDFHEDRRRLLDVLAGRAHEPRRLPQFRQDAAGAFRFRRVVENGLRGEARRERVGIHLRVAFPGPHAFQIELAAAHVRRHNPVLDLLHFRERVDGDRVQAPGETRQGAQVRVDRGAAEVLEEVVVEVNTVQRGAGRVRLVQVVQVIVDKVRKGFGGVHSANRGSGDPAAERFTWATIRPTPNRTIKAPHEGDA